MITFPLILPAIVSNVTLLIAWGLKCFDYPMAVARNMEAAQTVSMYVYDDIFGFNKAGIGQAAAIIITVVLIIITQCITSAGAKLEVDSDEDKYCQKKQKKHILSAVQKVFVGLVMVIVISPFYISVVYALKNKNDLSVNRLAWPSHPTHEQFSEGNYRE